MPLPVKRKEKTFESLQQYAFLSLHLSKLSKQHWIDMIVVANDPGCNVSPSLTLTLIRGLPYNKGCVNCSVLSSSSAQFLRRSLAVGTCKHFTVAANATFKA